jgi:hypothetical protein
MPRAQSTRPIDGSGRTRRSERVRRHGSPVDSERSCQLECPLTGQVAVQPLDLLSSGQPDLNLLCSPTVLVRQSGGLHQEQRIQLVPQLDLVGVASEQLHGVGRVLAMGSLVAVLSLGLSVSPLAASAIAIAVTLKPDAFEADGNDTSPANPMFQAPNDAPPTGPA